MGKYHVQRAKDGQFFFNLRADNGEKILASEMYTTKGAALGGIASVKENSGSDAQYARKESTNSKWYFTLKAKNHEVIGASEMYNSVQSRDQGIESCKKNGPTAGTQDDTES